MSWNPDQDPFHNAEAWQQPAVDREVDLFLAQTRESEESHGEEVQLETEIDQLLNASCAAFQKCDAQ